MSFSGEYNLTCQKIKSNQSCKVLLFQYQIKTTPNIVFYQSIAENQFYLLGYRDEVWLVVIDG